jgi:hypothetical protein
MLTITPPSTTRCLATTNHTDSPPLLIRAPRNGRLIANRLRRNTIHDKVLSPMEPLVAILALHTHTLLDQVRSAKHRAPSEVPGIDRHHERVLAVLGSEVLGDVLGVREVVVHADEGARDVGLLVQMGEAEARERGGVAEDRSLVLGGEAGGEGVPSLRGGAVYAVDEGWDGGWGGFWRGWG